MYIYKKKVTALEIDEPDDEIQLPECLCSLQTLQLYI